MKIIKHFLSTLIALLAVSFTLMAQAGAFEKTIVAPAETPCYTLVTNISPNPPTPNELQQGVTSCITAVLQIGKVATFGGSIIDSDICNGSSTFCCATRTADGRIKTVYCQN